MAKTRAPKTEKTAHITMMYVHRSISDIEGSSDLFCGHCGDTYIMSLPCNMQMFTGQIQAFTRQHRSCKPDPAIAARIKARYDAETYAGDPWAWFIGGATGVSSETIFGVMMRVAVKAYGAPHDPDDFSRCRLLLQVKPDWRPRLGEVAARFPVEWAALVEHWDELEALWMEENPNGEACSMPRLYERIKQLRATAE